MVLTSDSTRFANADAHNANHDHQQCQQAALQAARRICESAGTRLTELRERVLQEVWAGHEAVKAYDLLEVLGDKQHSAKPPTVYRALQFLQEQGLVHRLESLNAFVGCPHPEACQAGAFLICSGCGTVQELDLPGLFSGIAQHAAQSGFTVQRQTVEVQGICADCGAN